MSVMPSELYGDAKKVGKKRIDGRRKRIKLTWLSVQALQLAAVLHKNAATPIPTVKVIPWAGTDNIASAYLRNSSTTFPAPAPYIIFGDQFSGKSFGNELSLTLRNGQNVPRNLSPSIYPCMTTMQ